MGNLVLTTKQAENYAEATGCTVESMIGAGVIIQDKMPLVKVRISPMQRTVLHILECNNLMWDSDLTEFQKKPYYALQRKGLIQLTTGICSGRDYWELV